MLLDNGQRGEVVMIEFSTRGAMSFSENIRKELSHETGGYCANPNCKAATGFFVPRRVPAVGDAAHIVAEQRKGPRGESSLTEEERAMASNGVWLCPTCHRLVDHIRPQDYPPDLLRQWKEGASIWWEKNQGRPLQLIARPDERPKVARPSAASLQGAKNFYLAHRPLLEELHGLTWMRPAPFERDIPMPEKLELHIASMSSAKKHGRSWQQDWSTRFHCDDQELLAHMTALIRVVDALERPLAAYATTRRISFLPPDDLASAVRAYIDAYDKIGECLQKYDSWGIR